MTRKFNALSFLKLKLVGRNMDLSLRVNRLATSMALYFSAELEERMTLTAKNMLKREKHFGNKSVKEKEILIHNSI